MGWVAKPSGQYGLTSAECLANVHEINMYLNSVGFTLEAQAGIVGNLFAESGMNPWRWQSDYVHLNGGYGLFQYTPASGYINGATSLPHYSPNMSTSQQTTGATPEDGLCQLICFYQDTLGKWNPYLWRSYWSPNDYPAEWSQAQRILLTYGTNGRLSMSQFSQIDNVDDATLAFLGCFEGPGQLHLQQRETYADTLFPYLTADTPKKKMPLWMMCGSIKFLY